jgi:hypothetical protein
MDKTLALKSKNIIVVLSLLEVLIVGLFLGGLFR